MTLKYSVFEGRNTDFFLSSKELSFAPMLQDMVQNTWTPVIKLSRNNMIM